MAKIAFTFSKDSINLTFPGSFKTIHRTHPFFADVVKHIRNNELDSNGPLGKILDKAGQLKKSSNGVFDMIGDCIFYNGSIITTELSNKIFEYTEANIPYDNLILFHESLSNNPSEHVRNELWKFLDRAGHPLTEDGCFIAYRKCREDYFDGHSGTFRNMIGDICVMDRKDCDDNPENTCSRGLHAASYNYAKSFLSGGHLMAVKIDPKDVVSIPKEYKTEKLRCCKFEVVDEIDAPYTGLVFTQKNTQVVTETDKEDELDSADNEWLVSDITLTKANDTDPVVDVIKNTISEFIGDSLDTPSPFLAPDGMASSAGVWINEHKVAKSSYPHAKDDIKDIVGDFIKDNSPKDTEDSWLDGIIGNTEPEILTIWENAFRNNF